MTAPDGAQLVPDADPRGTLNLFGTDDTLCSAPGCPLTPIDGEHIPGSVRVGQAGYAKCTADLP